MKKFFIPMLVLCLMQANTVKAEDTDLSMLDNVVYVAPQAVMVGMENTLSICMKNTAAIRGFQFDMYLPDGITAVKSAKGRIQGALSEDRLSAEDGHELTFSVQPDGAVRFLCGSQYDETFTGNDGEIATLKVGVAAEMPLGEHPVVLKTVKLTETDISKYYLTDEVRTTLTVTFSQGVEAIRNAASTHGHTVYNMAGQRLEAPVKGVNIVGGKKMVVK